MDLECLMDEVGGQQAPPHLSMLLWADISVPRIEWAARLRVTVGGVYNVWRCSGAAGRMSGLDIRLLRGWR